MNDYNNYANLFKIETVTTHSINSENDNHSGHIQEEPLPQENFDEILNFLEGKKVNIYKNIINGFYTHILNCKNEMLISLYVSLLNNKWSFKYIQKRVKKSYKKCNRLNLKLKNLISKNNLNRVFLYFLENYDTLWLNNSKIKNKELYKQSIDLLLKAHEFNILDENIKYYKKQKKVLIDD